MAFQVMFFHACLSEPEVREYDNEHAYYADSKTQVLKVVKRLGVGGSAEVAVFCGEWLVEDLPAGDEHG